jgi:hypothetical protein
MCLAELAARASRTGNVLSLKLDDGSTRTFRSNPEACKNDIADKCINYRLIDSEFQFPNLSTAKDVNWSDYRQIDRRGDGGSCEWKVASPRYLTPSKGRIRLDSEQFRCAPRTYRPAYSRLTVR